MKLFSRCMYFDSTYSAGGCHYTIPMYKYIHHQNQQLSACSGAVVGGTYKNKTLYTSLDDGI